MKILGQIHARALDNTAQYISKYFVRESTILF